MANKFANTLPNRATAHGCGSFGDRRLHGCYETQYFSRIRQTDATVRRANVGPSTRKPISAERTKTGHAGADKLAVPSVANEDGGVWLNAQFARRFQVDLRIGLGKPRHA